MIEEFWPLFYGFLTLSTFAIAAKKPASGNLLAISVLTVLFVITNIGYYFERHKYNQYFPISDGIAVIFLTYIWRNEFETWKFILVLCLFADIVFHVIYFSNRNYSSYNYALTLNLLYIIQLLAVASSSFKKWK